MGPSVQKDQGKRPQGIKKERPQLSSRKSARLETVYKDRNTEPKHPLPSSTSNTPGRESPQSEGRKTKAKTISRRRDTPLYHHSLSKAAAGAPSMTSRPAHNWREHSGRCQREGDQPT